MTENELNEVLDAAFKNIKIGMHIYQLEDEKDELSLRMIYVSDYSEDLIAIKSSDLIGNLIEKNFPSITKNNVCHKYAEVVRNNKPVSLVDLSYEDNRLAGAFAITAYPLPHNCVAVMFDNVTARVEAEAQLTAKNEELGKLNAMMTDRELKMIELKARIAQLEGKS